MKKGEGGNKKWEATDCKNYRGVTLSDAVGVGCSFYNKGNYIEEIFGKCKGGFCKPKSTPYQQMTYFHKETCLKCHYSR